MLSQLSLLVATVKVPDGRNAVKMGQECAIMWHRSGGVLEKLKHTVNAAPCWVWLLGMTCLLL